MTHLVSKDDFHSDVNRNIGLGLLALGQQIKECFPVDVEEVHLVIDMNNSVLKIFRHHQDAEQFINSCTYPEEKEIQSVEIN